MRYANRSKTLIIAGWLLIGWLAYALHSGYQKSSLNQLAFQGEAACESLKQERLYDSLEDAVSAARYRIYADEKTGNAFYSNNSAQQLSAYFMPDAARITVKHNASSDGLRSEAKEQTKTEAPVQSEHSQLSLRFIGAGYGNAIHRSQGRPAITTADHRLSYTHRLTSNQDSARDWLDIFAKSGISTMQSAIVEEWYLNKAEGLEHGFTLNQPISERVDGEWLSLELELDGDFLAQAVDEGKAIAFKSKDGGTKLSYSGLQVFDAQRRELAAQMSVKDSILSFEVDDAHAVYPITIDPTFTQQQKLVPGTTASDSFGSDVAISGDTAVVGAAGDDIGANANQGSIFVFVRSGTTWSQQARLFANDGAADDNFGSSVAISANTIVVSAPNDDIGSNQNQGSAYVFVRNITWGQQAKLTASDGASGDKLGNDVAIDGDYAAIAAVGDNNGSFGTVRVFHRVGTSWTNESTIYGDDSFGQSIAISGDTLVVGEPNYGATFLGPHGAVHIMVRNGTAWSVQTFIEGEFASDTIGFSVTIGGNTLAATGSHFSGFGSFAGLIEIWVRSGTSWARQLRVLGTFEDPIGEAVTIDGDTVVYAAPSGSKVLVRTGTTWTTQATLTSVGDKVSLSGNTVLTGSPGYAKVNFRTGTTWAEQAELTAQEGGTADQFGYSVAIDGDTSVVGVPFKNVGAASDQGSVFVFKRSGSTWQQEAQLTAIDGAAGHRFGYDVAIEGDTIVVGSPQPLVSNGAVYVFTRSGTTWTQRAKVIASDGQGLDFFGNSVALSGNSLVVGAPLEESTGGDNDGSAYVFTGSGATWTFQAKLRAIEEAAGNQFGYDVDIDGESIAVGARFVANGANTLQGAAYVFIRAGTTWTQQARLLASDGATGDYFGESLSVNGNTLAVGSQFHNIGANSNQGAVYIFNRSGSTWTESQILTANDGAVDDMFGVSVALQSNALLVGASGDDFASTNAQGSAYVFIPFGSTWTQVQKLFALDGATNDGYGNAVALNDRTLLIGASGDDFGSTVDQGSAFALVPIGPSVWTGANSANWSNGGNWDSSVAPNVFDDVLLPPSGVTNEAVVNINANIHSLTVEAGRSLTINAGRTLTVNGDLTLNGTIVGGGTLVFNGANFINNNSANVANVRFGVGLKQLSGTGLFFGNTATVLFGSTLQLSSDHTMNRLVVNNGGTLNIDSTKILSLLGSGVALTNNGSITGTGAVSFDGASAQSTSGNVAFPSLTINNSAGVTLGANATVDGVLNLASGDLNTGTFTLTMPATATSAGTTDVVGLVKLTGFTTANTLSFGNPFNTIRFTSGTPPTDVTVNLVKQAPANFTNAVRRTYTITPNGGGGFAATLRLHYLESELNGNPEATLGLWRKGASWINLGATTRNATDNWVELAGIAQFSPWVISGPAAPTAVEFAGATATRFDDGTLIEWQTGFEVSNLGFILYREENGKRERVNPEIIAGSALVAGPATMMTAGRSYAWFDKHLASQSTAYWLEDLDTNGESTWHGPFFATMADGPLPTDKRAQSRLLSGLGASSAQNQSACNPFQITVPLPRGHALSSSLQKMIASGDAVKLAIKEEGWYRVTRDKLVGAGLAAEASSRDLQLFVDGVEQPLLVASRGTESTDSFDAIEFYGVGADSPYSDLRTYYLVAGRQPGRRIPVINTKPDSTGAASFPFTIERKERSVYFAALLNGDAENWFGAVVTSQGAEQPITIRALDKSAPANAELDISLQGVTELAASPDHQVDVQVNHQIIGRLVFDGREHKVERLDIPLALLYEGDNLVTLTAANPADVSLVDSIRVTYPRRYMADGDALKLATAVGYTSQRVDGFTSEEIRTFDVTDPRDIRQLIGIVEATGESRFSVTVDAQLPNRTLLALTASQFNDPISITANRPSFLASKNNQADFIIITHRDWYEPFEPLRALRQQQGLLTMLVDVEDIFDEFSFGQKTPYAVRDFLRAACQNWARKPRFVLMAGDASFDPRKYRGLGETDFLPTKLLDTTFLETASDDWLVDFNGDGQAELAIGRLPVRTEKEASAMVNKLLRYEAAVRFGELVLFADLNDGFDFEMSSSQLRSLLPSSVRVQEIFRSRNGDAVTKAMLLEAINRGPQIVNYVGHGSVTNWRGNILTSLDAQELTNTNGLAVFVMMNCLNGYFQDPLNQSLAEALIRNETGGAIAVWASSGMTMPGEQTMINQELYRAMFGTAALRLGEAVGVAKQATADKDVRRSWILFGDPTMIVSTGKPVRAGVFRGAFVEEQELVSGMVQ